MAYSAEISRKYPGCIIFVVDRSYSMHERLGTGLRQGSVQTCDPPMKAEFVADVLNKTLHNFVITCTKNSDVYHYFDIGVIGYGGAGVGTAFSGPLAGSHLASITDIAMNPARHQTRRRKEPDGVGGVIEYDVKLPIWFEPAYTGGTPMYEAFALVRNLVAGWTATHRESFPPIILHVTDGQWNTSDPSGLADEVQSLATTDGTALFLHLHVSAEDAEPVLFPASEGSLPPDDFAQALFHMSSPLTDDMVRVAQAKGRLARVVQYGSRGYVFNGGLEDVVDFFDIGTRPAYSNLSSNP